MLQWHILQRRRGERNYSLRTNQLTPLLLLIINYNLNWISLFVVVVVVVVVVVGISMLYICCQDARVFADLTNRIMSRAHLLFILLAGLPVCVPTCLWRWEWSFQNPPPPSARPPLSPSCLLSQSDSFLLHNSGQQHMWLHRVSNETALLSCEANQLIGQSLLLPPNSSVYLNLSHSNQVGLRNAASSH